MCVGSLIKVDTTTKSAAIDPNYPIFSTFGNIRDFVLVTNNCPIAPCEMFPWKIGYCCHYSHENQRFVLNAANHGIKHARSKCSQVDYRSHVTTMTIAAYKIGVTLHCTRIRPHITGVMGDMQPVGTWCPAITNNLQCFIKHRQSPPLANSYLLT